MRLLFISALAKLSIDKFGLLGLFLGFGLALQGQLLQFSGDQAAYLPKLREYLEEENKRDLEEEELDTLFMHFKPVWNDADYTKEERALTIEISNKLIRKRVDEFASWRYFLEVIRRLEEKKDESLTTAFLDFFKPISGQPSRRSVPFLKRMYLSFHEQVLWNDGRLRWAVEGPAGTYGMGEEPYFDFEEVQLWGYYSNDSTLVDKTSFRYFPFSHKLKATKGQAYFDRAGYSRDSAFVNLGPFQIDVAQNEYAADSVRLHFKAYLDQAVYGSFEEKLTSFNGKESAAVFPRFRSLRKRVKITRLPGEVRFLGGISVIGAKFYGSGNDASKAELLFYYKDTLRIRGRAERFLMRPDMLYSEDVATSLYLKEDSIYHPKLTMRFLPGKKEFTLIREEEGMGMAPFNDTYHQMDMKFQTVRWEVGSPLMQLSNLNTGGAEAPVVFESHNYYRDQRWRDIEGMNRRSPLLDLRDLSRSRKSQQRFTTREVADHLRMTEGNAHRFLMRMAIYGFVTYYNDRREVILKDKIFEYYRNIRGIRDYDVIQFVSRVEEGPNAQLSMENHQLDINGIDRIALSDSQRVGLYPAGKKIEMKKGLDFDFNGKISAGRFNYWGKQFAFSYDEFMIGMKDIDSMRFKVVSFEKNLNDQYELVDVKTVLQDLTGELLIDKANNKSGKESYSQYPIFRCGTNSYIYYDKPSTFGGVYNREEFFVELEPFTIDSLDNTSTRGLTFDGTFTSAGIFPDMDQTIRVQKDYSLGFTTETPPEGLSAYGGKGTFNNRITLSNEGLRGHGRIDYLQSTAVSDTFYFFPDSTKGLAQTYDIEEQTGAGGYPAVQGQQVEVLWQPYQDVFYTTSTPAQPFAMYGDLGMRGTGRLAYGPDGLHGRGLMEFLNAETRSQDYTFLNRKLLSPKLAFRVRPDAQTEWAFSLSNADAEVDFDAQRGYFSLNDTATYQHFEANQYISYMNYARWLIPQKAIETEEQGGDGLARMVSVHGEQDSLDFLGEKAKFYMQRDLLEVFKVPQIQVADAQIFPDTGYVAIDTAADMRTLTNASLTASIADPYHQFYGATLDITSAHDYAGNADYEYVDRDGTPWPIHFEDVHADTGTTVGFGKIAKDEYFHMSPQFSYYGNVRLKANRRPLAFQGQAKIEADCENLKTDWLSFKSLIDPDSIVINIPTDEAKDVTKLVSSGLYLDRDTVRAYGAFLASRVPAADKQVFYASGVVYYDYQENCYVVTTQRRKNQPEVPANRLRLYDNTCQMKADGNLPLGEENSQMKMGIYGSIDYEMARDDMQLDLVMALDFPYSKDLSETMAQLVLDFGSGEGIGIDRSAFKIYARHLLERDDYEDFMADVSSYGLPEKLPKAMRSTLLLGEVKLRWSPASRSFRSEEKVGLLSLGDQLVNTRSRGSFELQLTRRGPELYTLMELDPTTDLFLEYKRNIFSIFSDDQVLMDQLKEMKLKDRRNEEKGYRPFTFMFANKGDLNRFIRRMNQYQD
ncbi:MAG: hypothetical protein RI565_07905 [Schleiferiaceae bacterium]|nr:hypothetical protein [Schleiferiaceae bacterium]